MPFSCVIVSGIVLKLLQKGDKEADLVVGCTLLVVVHVKVATFGLVIDVAALF